MDALLDSFQKFLEQLLCPNTNGQVLPKIQKTFPGAEMCASGVVNR